MQVKYPRNYEEPYTHIIIIVFLKALVLWENKTRDYKQELFPS